MRRKLLTPVAFALVLLLGAALVVWFAKRTVAYGEKYDDFAGVTYGYRIEQYYFWNSSILTIWVDRGVFRQMSANYYLQRCAVEKIDQERWLPHDSAIYLNLRVRHVSSIASVEPVRIIYDFHRGEMFTSSNLTLWRFWNTSKKPEGWISETEFDVALSRLNQR